MKTLKINYKWIVIAIIGVLAPVGYYYYTKSNHKPTVNKSSTELGLSNMEKNDDYIKPNTSAKVSEFGEPGWLKTTEREKNQISQQSVTSRADSIKNDDKEAALKKLSEALATLDMKNPKAASEIISIIKDIEKTNGSSVLHGIRLDALRENMEQASKLNALSSKMIEMEKINTKEGIEEKKKLMQMSLDMMGKIRTDIVVNNTKPQP